jgi:putative peptidoglycan lipid II flippase
VGPVAVRTTTLLGAAAGIAVVTAAARVVGFGRTAVLGQTVGPTRVGDTYAAVNALPNAVFEVAAGGALAAVVVPLVATALPDGTADRVASALLSWTVAVLLPLSVLTAVAAPLLVRLVLDGAAGADATASGTRLLRLFAPQVLLYGVAIATAGLLQAHRRFLAPALAPLLSSVVVIGAYLAYAATGPVDDPAALSDGQELVLGLGTTLGVAALAATSLVALRGTGLRLRWTLSFPPGVAERARALAASGVAGLVAQQVSLLVALRLATGGEPGDAIVFSLALTVFLVPWSVLALPVATSAYPRMGGTDHAAVVAEALRAAVRLSLLGALGLAAAAAPLGALLLGGQGGASDLRDAVIAFAPGLVAHGASAVLARSLLARDRARDAAVGTATAWLAVAGLSVLLVATTGLARPVALGLASSLGLTVGGLLLLGLERRAR